MFHALKGLVIKVDMGYFNIRVCYWFYVQTKAVILCCNLYLFCDKIFDRMIGAAVTEFQFKAFSAKCKAEELMTQADSEYWVLLRQILNGVNSVFYRLKVTRTIR